MCPIFTVKQLFQHHVQKLVVRLSEDIIQSMNFNLPAQNAESIRMKVPEVVHKIIESTVDVTREINKLILKTFTIPANITLPEDYRKCAYTEDDELELECRAETLLKYFKQV